jgi:cephalosporin hydroxylase
MSDVQNIEQKVENVTKIDVKTPSKEEILQNIRKITDEFHKIWYPLQGTVSWMGVDIMKNPMDLLIYSEIIYENRPDLIIECGTFKGGSALFLANLCELNHHGRVLSIDIMQNPTLPLHPRIDYAIGSSVDENIVKMVHSLASSVKKVMVILDSDHTKQHVLDEMNIYSNFVTRGQYLIVEDSNIHGNPVRDDLPEGPFESIQEFFENEENGRNFIIDKICEKFLFTFNPSGYLRRIR